MPDIYYNVLYILLAVLLGGYAFFRLNRMVKQNEDERLRFLRRRKRFDAIPTNSPLRDPRATARSIGVKSIQTRYVVIRRLLLPGAMLFAVLVLIVPALSSAPAIYASFLVGMVTVIVGVAAKPVIENVIAGLVIALGQSLRIGDTVRVDDHYGTVEDLRLSHTIIKIWDWRRYVIPNSQLLQKEFVNYSLIDSFIWAHVEFHVAPETDLELVRRLASDAVKSSSFFTDYEEPSFWVMSLDKDSVKCWIASWANSPSEAWSLKHETRTAMLKAFREHGVRTQNLLVTTQYSGQP